MTQSRNNNWRWILLLIQLVLSAAIILFVLRLQILPARYAAVLIVFQILAAGLTTFLFLRSGTRWVNMLRFSVGTVLSVFVIAASVYGLFALNKLNRTWKNLSDNYMVIGVYVLKEDPAQDLSDTEGYSFLALVREDGGYTNTGIGMLREEVGKDLNLRETKESDEAAQALYDKKVEALIMSEAYTSILEKSDAYKDFSSRTRLIYEVRVPYATKDVPEDMTEQPFDEAPFVVYFSGSDTRSRILDTSRSDINILMVANPLTKQILLINTPRDYYIPNPAGNGEKDKLTHCGVYGIDCSMQALADLYDLDVRYYMQINFTGFEQLIDSLGGISVYSDTTFSAGKYQFQQGYNDMNGAKALVFVRDRYHQKKGDHSRGVHQMEVIKAIIHKAAGGTDILLRYSDLLYQLQDMLATNISTENFAALVRMQLNDMADWHVVSYSVTGADGRGETYSMPGQSLYIMHPDEYSVIRAQGLAKLVLRGDILPD